MIGTLAVGIERVIEAFWAFWEWTGHARNPLGPLSSEYRRAGAHLGVALTGLIFGLGSGPTHEVIQILKEIKIGRKTAN